MDQLIKTSGSTCGAPHIWREALVNVAAAVGAPCINHFLGTLTITSSTAVEDYYALVRRTVVANAPPMGIGGSGSYNAQWTLRPEQIVTNTTEGSITDGFGNTYWQSRKSIKFRKAYDNLPYRTLVSMVANDPTLGTSDVREMSVYQSCVPGRDATPARDVGIDFRRGSCTSILVLQLLRRCLEWHRTLQL